MIVSTTRNFHTLREKAQEVCPNCTYFSKDATFKSKRGRYLGFDLGEGVEVGVFRRANSNLSQLLVRGPADARKTHDEDIRKLVGIISERGFFGAY